MRHSQVAVENTSVLIRTALAVEIGIVVVEGLLEVAHSLDSLEEVLEGLDTAVRCSTTPLDRDAPWRE